MSWFELFSLNNDLMVVSKTTLPVVQKYAKINTQNLKLVFCALYMLIFYCAMLFYSVVPWCQAVFRDGAVPHFNGAMPGFLLVVLFFLWWFYYDFLWCYANFSGDMPIYRFIFCVGCILILVMGICRYLFWFNAGFYTGIMLVFVLNLCRTSSKSFYHRPW